MNNTTTQYMAFTLLFGLLIGTVSGLLFFNNNNEGQLENRYQSGFEDGLDEAENRLIQNGYFLQANESITQINGEIREIKENSLIVSVNPIHPLANESLHTRTLELSEDTQVFEESIKSDEEFNTEIEEFENSNSTSQSFPSFTTKKEVSLDILDIGDRITINAKHNILEKSVIEVSNISFINPETN